MRWLLKSWHERIVVSSDGATIATVVSDADKHLVAAAPELLDLARQYASECGECAGVGIAPDDEPCDECKFIRDVLARAAGEQGVVDASARRIEQLERADAALRSLLIRLEVLGFNDEHAPVSGSTLVGEIAALLPELTDAVVERET